MGGISFNCAADALAYELADLEAKFPLPLTLAKPLLQAILLGFGVSDSCSIATPFGILHNLVAVDVEDVLEGSFDLLELVLAKGFKALYGFVHRLAELLVV